MVNKRRPFKLHYFYHIILPLHGDRKTHPILLSYHHVIGRVMCYNSYNRTDNIVASALYMATIYGLQIVSPIHREKYSIPPNRFLITVNPWHILWDFPCVSLTMSPHWFRWSGFSPNIRQATILINDNLNAIYLIILFLFANKIYYELILQSEFILHQGTVWNYKYPINFFGM